MGSKARFCINMETGAIVFRTSETDKIPVIFRLVDDETANAVSDGKVPAQTVIDAVMKRDMGGDAFSWREYDRARTEAKRLMNVSQRNLIPATVRDAEADEAVGDKDVIRLADVSPKKAAPAKKAEATKEVSVIVPTAQAKAEAKPAPAVNF